MIIEKCHRKGKRSIVATHLLESMIENPIPTRAEVTDVANAIYEEVDGIMLSGETTVGRYPIRCIDFLDKISRTSEKREGLRFHRLLEKVDDKQHLAQAAVELAQSIKASGIVVITRRGIMAQHVTNCRPFNAPIFAFTNDSRTRRSLCLNRATVSHRIAFSSDPEKTLQAAFAVLKEREGLSDVDKVVVISDIISAAGVDAIQIRRLN
jgi:pyruvate kinase